MYIDETKLPLNNFVQKTISNKMMDFSKKLKGLDAKVANLIEVKKLSGCPSPLTSPQIFSQLSKVSFF
jgi:hypothetical protein